VVETGKEHNVFGIGTAFGQEVLPEKQCYISYTTLFWMPQQLLEPGTPFQDYFLQDKIGEGASGSVFSGLSVDNHEVVLKFIPLTNSWFHKEFKREVSTLKKFRRAKPIVTIVDSFTSGTYGVIVMEKMQMDLLDYIEQGPIAVDDVKVLFRQVADAIRILHSNNTAHLDIKPENIFMNDIRSVKLGDFGTSFRWSEENPKKFGVTGTTFYCAPEVKAKDSYAPAEADIWSLGILLHVLLTGFWPYSATSQEQLSKNIEKGKTQLLMKALPDDEGLIWLIRQMLMLDPNVRPSIKEILAHPFLKQNNMDADSSIESDYLQSYKFPPKIRQGLGVVASCSQPNLAELALPTEQDDIISESSYSEYLSETSESEQHLSAAGVRVREKRKKKPTGQKRRTSWSTKHFLGKLSKLVK